MKDKEFKGINLLPRLVKDAKSVIVDQINKSRMTFGQTIIKNVLLLLVCFKTCQKASCSCCQFYFYGNMNRCAFLSLVWDSIVDYTDA